jgi:hypothetical protein
MTFFLFGCIDHSLKAAARPGAPKGWKRMILRHQAGSLTGTRAKAAQYSAAFA